MDKLCYYCMTPTMKGNTCTVCGKKASSNEDTRNSGVLLPGTELDGGSVVVGEKIGRGGFGITYCALDRESGKRVALKEFMPNHLVNRASDGKSVIVLSGEDDAYIQSRRSFKREANILNTLRQHPNIVKVMFTIEENNTVYYGMEYLNGVNVAVWAAKHCKGLISGEDAFKLLLPAIDALIYCHRKHVLHRDISPDNILVVKLDNGQETVKLIDFGAAHAAIENFTKTFPSVLKQHFSPIEQMTRGEDQGTWSDVYSFCATIYFLITGKPPTSALDVVTSNNARIELPSKLGANISEDAEDVLMHGMVQDYRKRIQNMEQLREELARALKIKVPPYRDPVIVSEPKPAPAPVPVPETKQESNTIPVTVQEQTPNPVPVPEPMPEPEPVPTHKPILTPPANNHKAGTRCFLYLVQFVSILAISIGLVNSNALPLFSASLSIPGITDGEVLANGLLYTWLFFAVCTLFLVATSRHGTLGMRAANLAFAKGNGSGGNILKYGLFSLLTTSPIGWVDGILILMNSRPISDSICGLTLEWQNLGLIESGSSETSSQKKVETVNGSGNPAPIVVEPIPEPQPQPVSIQQQNQEQHRTSQTPKSQRADAVAALTGIEGPMRGKKLIVHDKDCMGRNPSAVQLVVGSEDATVGRVHCQFHYAKSNGKWGVVNFSSNGLFINDTFIAKDEHDQGKPVVIPHGAILKIGHSKYRFE